ncbi:hypothetical protein BJ912DRAFT_956313 [Pholiota molesta]|nr:hypothetical protein BJ912DRAFT_956313 [Pholiota molesta]
MALQLGAQAPVSDRASSLMGLPLDMQTYLLSFVAPLDILHLRMTCRAFHAVTSQQIVWIEGLRQICLANAVFLPTFPLDEMSLAELEHAAIAPYKWLALASARDGSASRTALNTHRMRFLSPLAAESLDSDEMDTAEEDDFEVRSLFLVPGGRYLVTFAWRWICVWDTGFSPHPENDYIHRPMAMVKVNLHSTHLVHASPDGQALRIIISCPSYVNEEKIADVLHVYELYPQRTEPSLDLMARLEVVGEDEISFYSLSGDCYIFLHGSVLKIWNFKINGWTSWTVQGEFHQAIVTPNLLLLIHSAGVSIWRIPRLMTNSPLFSFVNPTPLPPAFDIPYTTSRPPGEDLYAGPSDWYSGTPVPITYDRYEIVFAAQNNLAHAALIETPAAPYRFCLDALATWWFEADTDTMKIYTGLVRARRQLGLREIRPWASVRMGCRRRLSRGRLRRQLLSYSGRFVYLDDDDESLEPMDLLRSETDSGLPEGRWRDELSGWK